MCVYTTKYQRKRDREGERGGRGGQYVGIESEREREANSIRNIVVIPPHLRNTCICLYTQIECVYECVCVRSRFSKFKSIMMITDVLLFFDFFSVIS